MRVIAKATGKIPGRTVTRTRSTSFPTTGERTTSPTRANFVRRIERLKTKLQRPDLKFNVVAHSMGGLIARYAAMYGDADLPDG